MLSIQKKRAKYFPDYDFHKMGSSLYRQAVTNIYKTKEGRFFHLHGTKVKQMKICKCLTIYAGSINPNPSLDSLGLPHDREDIQSMEDAWKIFIHEVSKYTSEEIESIVNDKFRQAGTIAWTPDEYRASEHGKANEHVGLYQIHRHPDPDLPPTWWQSCSFTSPKRPLAGLKVVDLTRIIAGPTISRELAELGASVMRITAPHIADFSGMHADLNWGKWNAHLDLQQQNDRETLKSLIAESDVVIDGYRPGVMDKFGFGQSHILAQAKARGRGIVYLRENCYVCFIIYCRPAKANSF